MYSVVRLAVILVLLLISGQSAVGDGVMDTWAARLAGTTRFILGSRITGFRAAIRPWHEEPRRMHATE